MGHQLEIENIQDGFILRWFSCEISNSLYKELPKSNREKLWNHFKIQLRVRFKYNDNPGVFSSCVFLHSTFLENTVRLELDQEQRTPESLIFNRGATFLGIDIVGSILHDYEIKYV